MESVPQGNLAHTSLRNIVVDYDYVDLLKNMDKHNLDHGQLASYFCTIGMMDTDVIHTIMAVKEMIYCGYQIEKGINNSEILTGERH